jgi:GNAT superfamily N-acetyltransferase
VQEFHLQNLGRKAYIASIANIADPKTLKFANMSLDWWDKHFIWEAHGCVVLCDEEQNHLCYIFYKIDRYKMYLNIQNIFTPLCERRKGYAQQLLSMVFDLALGLHVKRFKLTSISNSLDFYLSLGFIYWGVNSVGDYYCDLPIPHDGLEGVPLMTQTQNNFFLLGCKTEPIYEKTKEHSTLLSIAQTLIYDKDLQKMQKSYRLEKLLEEHQILKESE